MNIKECYDKAGANYEDALNRLGSDMLVECFALKMVDYLKKALIYGHTSRISN